ncbi:MAG: efflux RND transporter periplasmic adaptor subunit [Methylococcaceae bacterium]|nr:efflux RND transporter periplasmic adaptor subunit [Methylococcaceae bacterium]
MEKRYIKSVLLSVFVIAAVILVIFYLKNKSLSVVVATTEKNVVVNVYGLGTVEVKIKSSIGFEVSAPITELYADQGDRVKKGTVLARLQNAEQNAKTQKAATSIKVAEVRLNTARSTIPKMKAILAQKKQNNQRSLTLFSRKLISKEIVDKTQMEEDVAITELAIARSEVKVAEAELADARAQYNFEKQLLEQYALRAPYDGLVIKRHKELGAVLSPGEAVFTLIDPKTIWILAYVDETHAGSIRVGQQAQVRLRSLPNSQFQGKVVRIDIESDRVNEERRVYIQCTDCPEQFHLGEQAEIFIQTAILEEALLIPETAIDQFNGANGSVWVVEKGRLQQQSVTLGHKILDGRVEIIDGLESNMQVVTNLFKGMRKGRKASIVSGE